MGRTRPGRHRLDTAPACSGESEAPLGHHRRVARREDCADRTVHDTLGRRIDPWLRSPVRTRSIAVDGYTAHRSVKHRSRRTHRPRCQSPRSLWYPPDRVGPKIASAPHYALSSHTTPPTSGSRSSKARECRPFSLTNNDAAPFQYDVLLVTIQTRAGAMAAINLE